MTFHLLKFGVKKSNLFDKIVVALKRCTCVTIDRDAIANIKGMLDEDEDDRLQEFLSGGSEEPGQGEKGRASGGQNGTCRRRKKRQKH